jgi:flagellar hook-basal body complex protein FliE
MSDMISGTGFRQSFLQPEQARGDQFVLSRTHPTHRAGRGEPPQSAGGANFGQALMNSLNDVNGAQQEHERLTVQSIIDPESVNAHDVTIASAKANMTLNITRNVVDRVIQAYRSITTLR